MGAAAFVMAGLTGIPYISICIAAFLPALLFVAGIGIYAHFQALKLGIAPVGLETDKRELLSTLPAFLIPLIVIVVLFSRGFSPQYVGFWAVVATLVLTLVIRPRPSLSELVSGVCRGASIGATIGVTCAAIGIVVQVVGMTGLGVRLGTIVAELSGGITVIGLLLTAVVTLILGCGVPTTPAYIIVGMIAAPVLVNMGYSLMQAHLFVLYMACMSMVTPPVAPSAVVASRIAEASFLRTAIETVKPAIAGWIVPFMFMLAPVLILQPGQLGLFQILIVVSSITTLIALQAGFVGHYFLPCTAIERALVLVTLPMLFVGAFMGSYLMPCIAVALFAVVTITQLRRKRRLKSVSEG